MAVNLWSHHVLADEIPTTDTEWSPTSYYKNYWGFEIEILQSIAQVLNFTYTFYNPTEIIWGHISEDGKWEGVVNLTAKNTVDFVICAILQEHARMQVIEALTPFDSDYMALCAPLPQLLPKIMALLYPFSTLVWVLIGISLAIVTTTMYITSNIESPLIQQSLHEWTSIQAAAWYAYGTLMGEAITRDTKSEKATALR